MERYGQLDAQDQARPEHSAHSTQHCSEMPYSCVQAQGVSSGIVTTCDVLGIYACISLAIVFSASTARV